MARPINQATMTGDGPCHTAPTAQFDADPCSETTLSPPPAQSGDTYSSPNTDPYTIDKANNLK
jgi:hypothetical protein